MTAPSQQSCTDYCSFTFLAERGQALQKCICGYIARDLRKGCCDVAVFARKKTAGCFPVAHRKYHAFFRNVHAIFNRGGSTKNKHTHTHVFDSKGSQRELRTLIHTYIHTCGGFVSPEPSTNQTQAPQSVHQNHILSSRQGPETKLKVYTRATAAGRAPVTHLSPDPSRGERLAVVGLHVDAASSDHRPGRIRRLKAVARFAPHGMLSVSRRNAWPQTDIHHSARPSCLSTLLIFRARSNAVNIDALQPVQFFRCKILRINMNE